MLQMYERGVEGALGGASCVRDDVLVQACQ